MISLSQHFDYLYGIVTTGRDWHFLLYSPGEIAQASDTALTIEFTKKALEKNSEEYKALYKGVKKVLGVIVGLLKDRACVEKSPATKRARVERYNDVLITHFCITFFVKQFIDHVIRKPSCNWKFFTYINTFHSVFPQ